MKRPFTIAQVLVIVSVLLVGITAPVAIDAARTQDTLKVHEWGTFTTIAGPDGQAMQWLPLGGPTDLPCFVEYYTNRLLKVMMPPEAGALLDYEKARAGLKGTVRMETPVLYFYASRPMTASVAVSFPQGLFTEFYPWAEVRQVPSYANILNTPNSLLATISWRNVNVLPGTTPVLPKGGERSHYYAARETDAAPIRVNGQDEKFLFYRGVAGFPVPISTILQDDGRLVVKNLGSHAMPGVMILTKRDGRFGYRVHGALQSQAEVVLAPPALDGSLPALRQELERVLVAQGLYAREAAAMVETWRDDWFNEGTRVFYVVGAPAIDAILPLQVSPAPAEVVRVFVGRMEVITPASVAAVERALFERDEAMVEAYGRWLGPIGERILAKTSAPDQRTLLLARLDGIFKSYLARVTACH